MEFPLLLFIKLSACSNTSLYRAAAISDLATYFDFSAAFCIVRSKS